MAEFSANNIGDNLINAIESDSMTIASAVEERIASDNATVLLTSYDWENYKHSPVEVIYDGVSLKIQHRERVGTFTPEIVAQQAAKGVIILASRIRRSLDEGSFYNFEYPSGLPFTVLSVNNVQLHDGSNPMVKTAEMQKLMANAIAEA